MIKDTLEEIMNETRITACFNTDCNFHMDGTCGLKHVYVDKEGKCGGVK